MATNPVKAFQAKLRALEYTRQRVEELYSQRVLARRDIESVYEGLFLRSVIAFEDCLEVLFFQIVRGRSPIRRWNTGAKFSAASDVVIREILLQDKDYLDWLPYKRTQSRAKLYLKGGRPFLGLGDGDLSKLAQIQLIRNAIAHASKFAREQFAQKVIGNTRLSPREKTPAGFLRSLLSSSPATTRLEVFVAAMGAIAGKLGL